MMKEKIANVFEKIKDFVEEHEEGVIMAVYGSWMIVLLGGSLRSLHLANEKMKLEIENLKK